MDNHQLTACHRYRRKHIHLPQSFSRRHEKKIYHLERPPRYKQIVRYLKRFPRHRARWLESINPEELNIVIGVSGPHKIPRVKERLVLTIAPYLETIDRNDPDAPHMLYSFGEDANTQILAYVQGKKTVDKSRNLHELIIDVLGDDNQKIALQPPKKYFKLMPIIFYKRKIFYPLAGSRFHMLYTSTASSVGYRGVVSKVVKRNSPVMAEYVPKDFLP